MHEIVPTAVDAGSRQLCSSLCSKRLRSNSFEECLWLASIFLIAFMSFQELSITFLRCLSLHLKRFSHAFLLKNKTCERFRRFEIFHPFLDSTEQSLSGSRCGHRAQKLSSHSPQLHDRNCVTFELIQSEFRIRIS